MSPKLTFTICSAIAFLFSAATDISTAYRYHWVDCHSGTSGATWSISEVEFYEAGGVVNMTLVSNAFTASSAPATGRIHIQVNPI